MKSDVENPWDTGTNGGQRDRCVRGIGLAIDAPRNALAQQL